jgi:putative transposase
MALAQQWFTAVEVAALALPGVPGEAKNVLLMADRENWRRPEWIGTRWRKREARGGGFEYHWSVLPPDARLAWSVAHSVVDIEAERIAAETRAGMATRWAAFSALPEARQREAVRRLQALDQVRQMVRDTGRPKLHVMIEVAAAFSVKRSTLYNWEKLVAGVHRLDWLPALMPRHTGRTATADCAEAAWDWLRAAYLRPEQPRFSDCYRDLQAVARAQGWAIPSQATLWRRIGKIPFEARVLGREGLDALKRRYPAQQRDRTSLHAMEAVNADGHKIDVFVRWPDGDIVRPILIVFQDLYSGKILSWRADRSENLEAVRVAFGDMIEAFGVPDHCTLDNTRTFASKRLTGGMSNRFRFKVKPDEPHGIMTTMGIKVHWSTPYSGQSKPIERAFRDFAGNVAKHPEFAGAYVGNNPMAKPENYGSKAVALDSFLAVVSGRIAEHNARDGRRSAVCGGNLSLDAAFEASYATSEIRKASEAQRRLWLMAAEDIVVRIDGVHFHGNRYWDDCLVPLVGKKVSIRFDPELLQEPLHIYRLDGGYLGAAPCLAAVGFYDAEAAREHGRRRRSWIKARRAMLDAERRMSILEAAAMMPRAAAPPAPETKVVRLIHGNTALAPQRARDLAAYDEETEAMFVRASQTQADRRLRLVGETGGD